MGSAILRITQVLTHLSKDGAFGGPARVAQEQAAALASRGHDVTVVTTSPQDEAGVRQIDGYTLIALPARSISPRNGFAAMTGRGLFRALDRTLDNSDVAHVHVARDLVTLPAAWRARRSNIPLVLQPHGMIDASSHMLARPLDTLLTRPILRAASKVLVLTQQETHDIQAVEPLARTQPISNGVSSTRAKGGGKEKMVLFLARLHPRKRPLAFVEMAKIVALAEPDVNFIVAGPDEGEGADLERAVREAGIGDRLRYIGAVEMSRTDKLLASAAVYVLPSVGEVFPMTVIEAFRAGTPVVTTTSIGIASGCNEYGAALLTDGSPPQLAAAVVRILRDPAEGTRLVNGGFTYLGAELSIDSVAAELERIYVEAIGEHLENR